MMKFEQMLISEIEREFEGCVKKIVIIDDIEEGYTINVEVYNDYVYNALTDMSLTDFIHLYYKYSPIKPNINLIYID